MMGVRGGGTMAKYLKQREQSMAKRTTTAQAAATMGGSHELILDFQPVEGLMVELQVSEQEEIQM